MPCLQIKPRYGVLSCEWSNKKTASLQLQSEAVIVLVADQSIIFSRAEALTFDDVNDLVRARAEDDVPTVHEDEFVSTPFRIDFHDT